MNSPSAIASNPSNLQDPLRRLPQEVFLQFFRSLPCKFILDSSTVSREWKDVILSSPTSFENLELDHEKDDLAAEEDSLARHANANRMIKKLLGYANLSNNRLKSVDLDFALCKNAYNSWDATRLSIVFGILRWSSSTLTILRLEFFNTGSELADAILHVAAVVKNLDCFKSLRTVEIGSELGLYVGSSSPSKLKEIRVYDRPAGLRRWDDVEVDEVHGSTLAVLFRQTTEFTGQGIEDVRLNCGYVVSLEALKELERSKDSLREITLDLEVGNELSMSKFQLAVKCPNLSSFHVKSLGSGRRGETSLLLEIPKDQEYPNKLKHLHLFHLAKVSINLGKEFCKNLMLETLSIRDYHEPLHSPPVDFQSLYRVLLSSNRSLKDIDLSGINLSAGFESLEGLQLHQLGELHVSGNTNLIRLFLDIDFRSLRELCMVNWEDDESLEGIDHFKVTQILECCQSSLERVVIRLKCKDRQASTYSASLEKADSAAKSHQRPFTLPKLDELSLEVDDDILIKHYLAINYPVLSRVWFPKSSSLSQSDFSLKPQDSALK